MNTGKRKKAEEQIEKPVVATGKKRNWKITLLRIIVFLSTIALSILIYIYRGSLSHLGIVGYPGLFLVSFLANATIFIPVPGIMIVTAMGLVYSPLFVSIVAGAGSSLGEFTGYIAGMTGKGIVENRIWYERVQRWMKKYGDLTIVILSIIPNPLLDMVGIVAGIMRYPFWRYLLFGFIGKTIKFLVFTYVTRYITLSIPGI
jgi:membrane protein YqaA with SNARE-associated domain